MVGQQYSFFLCFSPGYYWGSIKPTSIQGYVYLFVGYVLATAAFLGDFKRISV
jgi:hypothetical protein